MVLVDTSVWIQFLRNREPYAGGLEWLLSRDAVAAHDLVYGELVLGNMGKRQELLSLYLRMHRASTVSHAEVIHLIQNRKLNGRGIGLVDAHLLASSLVEKISLWTADVRLDAVAGELGIRFETPVLPRDWQPSIEA